jgi:hypothetical protein
MAAQDTVLLGAEALDGSAALMVEEAGAEFHGNALEVFKGMGKQEKFTLGVNARALNAFSVERGTDFDALVHGIDVHEGGHAESFASTCLRHDER